MTKGTNNKKSSKKKPLKTLKEKRQAKREKKNKNNDQILNQMNPWWEEYYISTKGKKMANYITCRHCTQTISNDPRFEVTAKKERFLRNNPSPVSAENI